MALSIGAESVDEVVTDLSVRDLHKRAIIRTESFSRKVKSKGG